MEQIRKFLRDKGFALALLACLVAAAAAGVGVRCIGRTSAAPGLRLLDGQGRPVPLQLQGFDHFAASA